MNKIQLASVAKISFKKGKQLQDTGFNTVILAL